MASWYGYAWWEWQHLEEFYELKCISWIIKLIEPLDERRDNDQENKSFLSCNQTLRDECWSIKLDENMNQSWIMFWDIADFSSINLDEFWCQIGEDLVVICGLTSSSSGLWMMKWSSSADSKVSTSNANSDKRILNSSNENLAPRFYFALTYSLNILPLSPESKWRRHESIRACSISSSALADEQTRGNLLVRCPSFWHNHLVLQFSVAFLSLSVNSSENQINH